METKNLKFKFEHFKKWETLRILGHRVCMRL